MTDVELTRIIKGVTDALKPVCEGWVDAAAKQLPYMVRQELAESLNSELSRLIRQKVQQTVHIDVAVGVKEPQ